MVVTFTGSDRADDDHDGYVKSVEDLSPPPLFFSWRTNAIGVLGY